MKQSLAGVLACALLWGCGGPAGKGTVGRGRVRVAAAADLNAALAELITRFTAAHPVDVSASYGSSGTFYAQLMNGAPYDLFLSADVEYPRRLAERGLTLEDSGFTYGVGRLVLWVPAGSPLDIQRAGLAVLTDAAVRRIAVANPEHAPYGRAAIAALRTAGLYDEVKPRLVYGENVAQALQFAQSGAADAGIVALSLALAANAKDGGRWIEIPPGDYPTIEQAGVIMRNAADLDSARAFRAYLTGTDGRAVLRQFGFSVPER